MTLSHATLTSAINVSAFGARLPSERTCALLKTKDMEVIRVVLRSGQSLPPHSVPGSITLHCLEGCLDVLIGQRQQQLSAGQLIHLPPQLPHAVRALEDSSGLVTIVLCP